MDAIVSTRQGVVQGSMAQGVAAFKGIPYAAAPFGSNRCKRTSRPSAAIDTSSPSLASRPERAASPPYSRCPVREGCSAG